MLYGKASRCPHPHARIRDIDTRDAEALSGVRAVLTYKNVPDWKTGMPKQLGVLGFASSLCGRPRWPLVAADTEEIASAAADLIKVSYEILPAVYDMKERQQRQTHPNCMMSFQAISCPTFPPLDPRPSIRWLQGMWQPALRMPILSKKAR